MMRNYGFIVLKQYLFLDMKITQDQYGDNKTHLAYKLGFIKGFAEI